MFKFVFLSYLKYKYIRAMPSPFIQKWLDEWDATIKIWDLNSRALSGLLSPFSGMVNSSKLSSDFLPEPYYGAPDNCSAVVLNINPGSSSIHEATKLWYHRSCSRHKLIYDFVNRYSSKYSSFQLVYSPFVAPNWVPGVQWWKDNRIEFIENVVKLYYLHKHNVIISERAANPFALELCPLHSKDISGINFSQKGLRTTYLSNVITPAVHILKTSNLPFGLGFSSTICNIFKSKECGEFHVVKTWQDGEEFAPSGPKTSIYNWPKDKNGNCKKRTYQLVRSDSFESLGFDKGVYFLFTWDRSGSIIKITSDMMDEYAEVDDMIIRDISAIV